MTNRRLAGRYRGLLPLCLTLSIAALTYSWSYGQATSLQPVAMAITETDGALIGVPCFGIAPSLHVTRGLTQTLEFEVTNRTGRGVSVSLAATYADDRLGVALEPAPPGPTVTPDDTVKCLVTACPSPAAPLGTRVVQAAVRALAPDFDFRMNVAIPIEVLNSLPEASNLSVVTPASTAVTADLRASCTDFETPRLSLVISAGDPEVLDASVVLRADGSAVYTPPPGWTGSDEFTYTVSDADGGSATATVAVTVTPVEAP